MPKVPLCSPSGVRSDDSAAYSFDEAAEALEVGAAAAPEVSWSVDGLRCCQRRTAAVPPPT